MSGMRNALVENAIALFSRHIAENAYSFISNYPYKNIGIYKSIGNEVRIEYITEIDKDKKFEFYMPACMFEDKMEFRKFEGNGMLEKDFYGIPCPSGFIKADKDFMDVYFIPGLAYDSHGNRIGYGKGCYDRFFTGLKEPKLIGVCYDFQFIRNESLESGETDVRVSGVITEKGLYKTEYV